MNIYPLIKPLLTILLIVLSKAVYSWGFFAHQQLNYYAVFLLPPEMLRIYKPHIEFLSEHAVDPDKRRYAVKEEGARHYIDMDHYGSYPFDSLPRKWEEALLRFGEDSLQKAGIVPWWIQVMHRRLVKAFKDKDKTKILIYSAEIGHYIADAHVPLHTSSNHNGQKTGQQGIHGFWESRVPELLCDREWDFFIGPARFISNPLGYTWERVLEGAAAVDSVLRMEKLLSQRFSPDRKYAFENRNDKLVRQYSSAFTIAYDRLLNGMVERRMRLSIFSTASFWYTAWVEAGQPHLSELLATAPEGDQEEYEALNEAWRKGEMIGRKEEE